jgi:hypothetical protein
MNLWIVLFSFLFPTTPSSPVDEAASVEAHVPLRYRGIEQLLAKFDAEADAYEGPDMPHG